MEQLTISQAPKQIAEIELIYRNKVKAKERPVIRTSQEAYEILMANWNSDTIELFEEFKVILLNRANRVLGIVNISRGGIHETAVDQRLIFASALKAVATSIILVHNHPSGALKPSNGDTHITQTLRQGGDILNIAVRDHLIISSCGYYSFVDEGVL